MVERLVEERNRGIHMKPESIDGIRAYAFVCGSKEAQRGSSEGALREQGGAAREHMAETGLSARAKRRGLSQQPVTYWPRFGESIY